MNVPRTGHASVNVEGEIAADPPPDVHHPRTRYVTTRDGLRLAAQRFGDGPDLVVLTGGFSHVEMRWEQPRLARSWRRLSMFATVTAYDPRGFGLSERGATVPTLDGSVEDALDVLDAFGIEHAAVHGSYEAGPVALLLAARHPDRVDQVFLENTSAKGLASDDFPQGIPADVWRTLREIVRNTDLTDLADLLAPGRAHEPAFRAWYGRWARYGAGPGGLDAVFDRVEHTDVRDALPHVRCPVTVIHRHDDPLIPLAAAEYIAATVPHGELVVLGDDTVWFSHGADECIDAIEAAMGSPRDTSFDDLISCAILVSDLVDSTATAAQLGDAAWRTLLDDHDRAAFAAVHGTRGRVVKTTGDGVLAVFSDGITAVDAALALRDAMLELGLHCRVGVHAGDVVRRGKDIGGLAVQIAARVCAEAPPDTVLVTESVAALGVSDAVALHPSGEYELKGVPDARTLMRATWATPPP